jgi:hypothetical protein
MNNISIITVFKNNIINLKLWLDHYIWQGVDHFYLINNGYEYTNEIFDIISNYNNLITYDTIENNDNEYCYKNIYNKYKLNENTKWLISANLDDFWYSKKLLINKLKHSNTDIIYSNYLLFDNKYIEYSNDIRINNIKRLSNYSDKKKWIIKTKKFNSDDIKVYNIIPYKKYKIKINNHSIFLNCYQTQFNNIINNSKISYIKDKNLSNLVKKYKFDENKFNENKFDETYFNKYYIYDKFNENINDLNITEYNDITKYIEENEILVTKNYTNIEFKPDLIDESYIDYIDKFILIVDFPNWGGGTTNFINRIISYYKQYTIFLIARNYNDNIIFTINDEYQLNNKFDIINTNIFLEKYKNKIDKIFINHTIGHSIEFLNKLFDLQKEITTITHDFYSINDKPCPYIHNINYDEYENINKININKYNMIITQNNKNLLIYNKHIKNRKIPIITTNLPDFKDKNEKIITNNSNIVIGIIGAISKIKGLNILNNIIKYYSLNKKVKIVLFGFCDIDNLEYINNFISQHIYSNIDELNKLLIEHKPNILIELSIWPETYNYTLTLAMITDLPIIYFKKTGNFVIEDRLSKYEKSYGFSNINELDRLVNIHKQNWFYTIKPIIYFNSFWDKYFIYINNNFNNIINNLIIITSKIIVNEKIKFNYCDKKSIYSLEERYKQTQNTIISIKKYIPNSYIIFIDNSNLSIDKYNYIKSHVDIFLNPIKNEKLTYFVDESQYKCLGETALIKYCIDYIKLLKLKFINYFKISGRYILNNNFNYNNFNNNNTIFKLNNNIKDRVYYYTSFYKINIKDFKLYTDAIYKIYEDKIVYSDLEVILPKLLNYNFLNINNIGLTQYISVWDEISNI